MEDVLRRSTRAHGRLLRSRRQRRCAERHLWPARRCGPDRDPRWSVALPAGPKPSLVAVRRRPRALVRGGYLLELLRLGPRKAGAVSVVRRRRLPCCLPAAHRGSLRIGPRRGPSPYRGHAGRRHRRAGGRRRLNALLAGAAAVDLGRDVPENHRRRHPGAGRRTAHRAHAAAVPRARDELCPADVHRRSGSAAGGRCRLRLPRPEGCIHDRNDHRRRLVGLLWALGNRGAPSLDGSDRNAARARAGRPFRLAHRSTPRCTARRSDRVVRAITEPVD